MAETHPSRILWSNEISWESAQQVGPKAASSGELLRILAGSPVSAPEGFSITARAYREFLEGGKLTAAIEREFEGGVPTDLSKLESLSNRIRSLIEGTSFPRGLEQEIRQAYSRLVSGRQGRKDVAVRSSATAEDLPGASFAGQLESFLNIEGEDALLSSVRKCFSSAYTGRAISYRGSRRISQTALSCSVFIQEMIRSDLAASGVAFTLDPETGHDGVILVNSSYGFGTLLVGGEVVPDEFLLHKATLREGFSPIVLRETGSKELSQISDPVHPGSLIRVRVPEEDRRRLSISDQDVLLIARACLSVEDHFSKGALKRRPMDIEWAKDGLSGRIYLVQARPETVHSVRSGSPGLSASRFEPLSVAKPLLTGRAIGTSVGQGRVRRIRTVQDLAAFLPGEVLVAEKTDPDWEPAMKLASAVVTASGGRTCHAAIVAREIGIPAIVGAGAGIELLKDGTEVTVSSAEGEEGRVYAGRIEFRMLPLPAVDLSSHRTRLLMNVSRPGDALRLSLKPGLGVGLLRLEFMIASEIRIHPLALLRHRELTSTEDRRRIEALTRGYEDKKEYFVDKLAQGIGRIAAAFHPREVVVRFSDFKSSEYAGLIGGAAFEPREENPMLGFRGSVRYSDPLYREAFGLECRAVTRVREEMGLRNLQVMIPFVRTLEDADRTLTTLGSFGLERGRDGLKVLMMCEVPSNVILMAEFCKRFDGISIGSNDLTQLTLGLDRDSVRVAPWFDERNAAVKTLIALAIREAHRAGVTAGLCGQAPSDFPDFARFLVREGIDSISLSPDALPLVAAVVLEEERRSIPHDESAKAEDHPRH